MRQITVFYPGEDFFVVERHGNYTHKYVHYYVDSETNEIKKYVEDVEDD